MYITCTLHVHYMYYIGKTNFIVLLQIVLHSNYIYITAITYIMFYYITILHVHYIYYIGFTHITCIPVNFNLYHTS